MIPEHPPDADIDLMFLLHSYVEGNRYGIDGVADRPQRSAIDSDYRLPVDDDSGLPCGRIVTDAYLLLFLVADREHVLCHFLPSRIPGSLPQGSGVFLLPFLRRYIRPRRPGNHASTLCAVSLACCVIEPTVRAFHQTMSCLRRSIETMATTTTELLAFGVLRPTLWALHRHFTLA